MSKRRIFWRTKLGVPPMVDDNRKEVGRGGQCGGSKELLQSTIPGHRSFGDRGQVCTEPTGERKRALIEKWISVKR